MKLLTCCPLTIDQLLMIQEKDSEDLLILEHVRLFRAGKGTVSSWNTEFEVRDCEKLITKISEFLGEHNVDRGHHLYLPENLHRDIRKVVDVRRAATRQEIHDCIEEINVKKYQLQKKLTVEQNQPYTLTQLKHELDCLSMYLITTDSLEIPYLIVDDIGDADMVIGLDTNWNIVEPGSFFILMKDVRKIIAGETFSDSDNDSDENT